MTVVCTKIMMEATKGIGQRDRKGATRDFFLFDSWLSSNNLAEAVMEIGSILIVMVKTNTKIFYKDTIKKLTKDCPGVSYLVLRSKHMVGGSLSFGDFFVIFFF